MKMFEKIRNSLVQKKLVNLHPHFSPSQKPPIIYPVDRTTIRPLWSVMIPTYNCAQYLRQTLESVLSQDPGNDLMQIEVIDDCSTQGDHEAVVREVAGDRVSFYRKPKNEGAIANFNTCIERSRGHLIHILHGDDYVLPRFYDSIQKMHQQHPDAAILVSPIQIVNEKSEPIKVTSKVFDLYKIKPSNDVSKMYYGCSFQFAGVVIQRSFYEQSGGFITDLIHTADWEMWSRATQLGSAISINEPLACYRHFEGNDTSKLKRTAENLRDCQRISLLLDQRIENYPLRKAHRKIITRVKKQLASYRELNDQEAVKNHLNFLKKR
jgi:glycosyltransferase involved in cell wall biosynthesis